ncbi:four helix bundle protein [Aureitalea sp. L0-47]|uniref:four helix bundle protein n=1 Tax=Aureitalea sp. L0-47 TaxID=2816962 RepID=UPI002AA2A000|nr:four helix bundle protein [Aureitalea sp. L0-47]
MSIASKEARETRYWLRLINEGKLVNFELEEYFDEIDQIIKMLTKIVKTSQSNT